MFPRASFNESALSALYQLSLASFLYRTSSGRISRDVSNIFVFVSQKLLTLDISCQLSGSLSVAPMFGFVDNTCLAFDFTAPVEATPTIFYLRNILSSVTSLTAQQLTATCANRCGIAQTFVGPQRALPSVLDTKVRGFIRVNNVFFFWRFMAGFLGQKMFAIIGDNHFGRTVKAVLENVAHKP